MLVIEIHLTLPSVALFDTGNPVLTLLHSERPKLYTILAFLSAIGLSKVGNGRDDACFVHFKHNWQQQSWTFASLWHYLLICIIAKQADDKIYICKIVEKRFCLKVVILRIQGLEGKQCRSR